MSGGFVERELAVARGLASCRGDDARLDEADAEIAKLRAENDALLEALKSVLYRFDPYAVPGYEKNVAAVEQAEAAIKTVEGEKT